MLSGCLLSTLRASIGGAANSPLKLLLLVGFLLGFLLGVFLGAQLLSGFLLACGYLPDPAIAFDEFASGCLVMSLLPQR